MRSCLLSSSRDLIVVDVAVDDASAFLQVADVVVVRQVAMSNAAAVAADVGIRTLLNVKGGNRRCMNI